MAFQIDVNEHDAIAYVKIQIAGKAIHEAALLAYYCDGRRKQQFHEEMEHEIEELLIILGVDDRSTARALSNQVEVLEYQIENLRAALRVGSIKKLSPLAAAPEASEMLRPSIVCGRLA
jgi:hypothetical protein